MFDEANIIAGLEIGTSKICVVVGELGPEGALNIIGVGQSRARRREARGRQVGGEFVKRAGAGDRRRIAVLRERGEQLREQSGHHRRRIMLQDDPAYRRAQAVVDTLR